MPSVRRSQCHVCARVCLFVMWFVRAVCPSVHNRLIGCVQAWPPLVVGRESVHFPVHCPGLLVIIPCWSPPPSPLPAHPDRPSRPLSPGAVK